MELTGRKGLKQSLHLIRNNEGRDFLVCQLIELTQDAFDRHLSPVQGASEHNCPTAAISQNLRCHLHQIMQHDAMKGTAPDMDVQYVSTCFCIMTVAARCEMKRTSLEVDI